MASPAHVRYHAEIHRIDSLIAALLNEDNNPVLHAKCGRERRCYRDRMAPVDRLLDQRLELMVSRDIAHLDM